MVCSSLLTQEPLNITPSTKHSWLGSHPTNSIQKGQSSNYGYLNCEITPKYFLNYIQSVVYRNSTPARLGSWRLLYA